ncbi:MAG TPA: hypothetical protein VHB21_09055, partial [Minicystis sp.]|nr:hypothetical protein [Minicystis sp.]
GAPRRLPASLEPVPRAAREVLVAGLLVVNLMGMASDPKLCQPLHFQKPRFARLVARNLNLPQGWELFAPDPFFDTHLTTIDATLADGRHVDPFTGAPPRTEFDGPLALSFTQPVVDLLRRQERFRSYNRPLLEYVKRYPERTGRPEDRVVRADIYLLHQKSPAIGTTEHGSIWRDMLISTDPTVQITPPKSKH